MGIFSIFKGKNNKPDGVVTPSESRLRGEPSRLILDGDAERARQREIARATAAKIDAIESAMADDIFNTPEPAWGSGPRRARGAKNQEDDGDTLPMLELATTELLSDNSLLDTPVFAQTAPVIEEIAIMFANDQMVVAEQMLQESLRDVGRTDRTVWWMLFDLYQVMGRQDDFDNVAIDYASQFETSPPTWAPPTPIGVEESSFAGVTPTEVFAGVLDGQVAPRLARLLTLSDENHVLRLEFGRITDVTPEGCQLMLDALTTLRKRERELIVAGATELSDLVRSTITIGQRNASEAPWLLLLALLQLLNREKDFEEMAMDYCVTFEVSPPSFETPQNVATTSTITAPTRTECFMLPNVINSGANALFDAIDAYAEQAPTLLIDCSRLARVDYGAASAMLNRLRPIAAEKKIEFRDMNHLVAALFKLLSYAEVARMFPHKY
ncbi:STAS domain-containing protein [Massilia sp. TSP1-1-2]|uniref:STAS domain-containing protein n=1 Tax=Massilia sp. TSP1-1-2 TaxID=2804649 RepID=UPI003CF683EE